MSQPKAAETKTVEAPIGSGWDERFCMRCGDEIEGGMESVTAQFCPDAEDEMDRRLVGDLHTWCAVQNGYRLRWESAS